MLKGIVISFFVSAMLALLVDIILNMSCSKKRNPKLKKKERCFMALQDLKDQADQVVQAAFDAGVASVAVNPNPVFTQADVDAAVKAAVEAEKAKIAADLAPVNADVSPSA